MRRAARTDGNHQAIVTALEAVGASVQSLAAVGEGCPDLLVGYRGLNFVLEVKNPKTKTHAGKAWIREKQKAWMARWRGQKAIVETVEDALVAIGARRVLATVEAAP